MIVDRFGLVAACVLGLAGVWGCSSDETGAAGAGGGGGGGTSASTTGAGGGTSASTTGAGGGTTASTTGAGGGDTTASTTTGAGGGTTTTTTTTGGGVCNELPLPPVVTKTADPGPLPAFTGGTIADGTYVVDSIVTYGTNTPGGTTVQEVYELMSGVANSAIDSSESEELHFSATYATEGNVLTYTITCPQDFTVGFEYTATPTTLAFQHGSDPNEVAYATKQ